MSTPKPTKYKFILVLLLVVCTVVCGVYAQIFENAAGVSANDVSGDASVTGDGMKAVFHSWATNLATAPRCANVFFKNIQTKEIVLIKDHALSPAFSSDGRYIAYEYSPDPDHGVLPQIMLYDTSTKKETLIAYSSMGNTKGGWFMPDIKIANGEILYHSTATGKLQEYSYNITSGKIGVVGVK